MEEKATELMAAIDNAGVDLPLADWVSLLESLTYEVEIRLDAAKADLGED
jgi:hypothetical protein